jgi:siroheme synthase (precorrin-2 oxidase/ferrochelatase)
MRLNCNCCVVAGAFYTVRWDHSVDLTGKRVAVIGTGAGEWPAQQVHVCLNCNCCCLAGACHTARWDHCVDLTGKRVAVVGTGAGD